MGWDQIFVAAVLFLVGQYFVVRWGTFFALRDAKRQEDKERERTSVD